MRVFLSYRRADEADIVEHIYDRLCRDYGSVHVFRDNRSVPMGEIFGGVIRNNIETCDVVLALIGPHWPEWRTSEPDYVQLEISAAFELGKPVIPVLLKGTTPPTAGQLPDPMKALVDLQFAGIRGGLDFSPDFDAVSAAIADASERHRRRLSVARSIEDAANERLRIAEVEKITDRKRATELLARSLDEHLVVARASSTLPSLGRAVFFEIELEKKLPGGLAVLARDGEHLAIASWGSVSGWHLATGERQRQLVTLSNSRRPTACDFSPDGDTLVVGCHNGTVQTFDVGTGELVHSLTGHQSSISGCQFSPNGDRILTSSNDGTLRIWDARMNRQVDRIAAHSGPVSSCSFSPDGRLAISAGADRVARIWDLTDGGLRAELVGHSAKINACGFSPDGRQVVSGSSDKTVRVWDVSSAQQTILLWGHRLVVFTCAFSPNGSVIVTGSGEGEPRIWNAITGELLFVLNGHRKPITSCQFSADGQRLLSISTDATLVWRCFYE